MRLGFKKIAQATAGAAGSPAATVGSFLLVIAWALWAAPRHFDSFSQLLVNSVTTVITFNMVFLLQASQNADQEQQKRDSLAVQAKLDELIRSQAEARNEFRGLEKKTEAEIQAIARDDCDGTDTDWSLLAEPDTIHT